MKQAEGEIIVASLPISRDFVPRFIPKVHGCLKADEANFCSDINIKNRIMKIEIIAGEGNVVETLINDFNLANNLDLKISKVENLEVNFVTVSSKKITATQIFNLGIHYQSLLQKLKEEGKFV